MTKIVIAGGTGFLGSCLANHYHKNGTQVFILTRGREHSAGNTQYVQWDGKNKGTWAAILENTDVLINLNGKSVDCRYTEKNKRLIYSTRLDATAALGRVLQLCANPPKLWINAASATIYRHSLDKEMDEYTGEIGNGFSVDVCQQWEKVFNQFEIKKTRKVLIRTGIVLGRNGGPLSPLKKLTQSGLGGKQGQGNQYFSWLHEDDFVSIIDFIISNTDVNGVFNATAPTPVPNAYFMKCLRSTLRMRFGFPLPKWLLEFGALLIGTETELILKSRRVIPKRLLEAGYKFKFSDIDKALADLCN